MIATNGYPFAAHTMASAIPVLPEVASTTGALGVLDDADGQTVLHRGQRVEELALHVQRGVLGRETIDAHDGSLPDRAENTVVDHDVLLRSAWEGGQGIPRGL
jgi:hypothetical protein